MRCNQTITNGGDRVPLGECNERTDKPDTTHKHQAATRNDVGGTEDGTIDQRNRHARKGILSRRIRPPYRITIRILIRMQAIRHLREARKRISRCKRALPRRVPPGPQIHLPRRMQFPREAEGLRGARRWYTPRIVLHAPQHPTRIVERLPHAAQRIADVPRPTQGAQAVVAVHIVRCPVAEHLAQRCGDLRIRRGHQSHRRSNEDSAGGIAG